jgi:hypothetical protein
MKKKQRRSTRKGLAGELILVAESAFEIPGLRITRQAIIMQASVFIEWTHGVVY